jgi:ACR3 family arsenite efflux pump ArsB
MEYETKLLLTLISLHLLSWGYNALIAWMERAGHLDGFVSLSVVVGVAYTVAGAGWLIGWDTVVTLALVFLASGIPMIAGSISRYIRERKAEEEYLFDQAKRLNGDHG